VNCGGRVAGMPRAPVFPSETAEWPRACTTDFTFRNLHRKAPADLEASAERITDCSLKACSMFCSIGMPLAGSKTAGEPALILWILTKEVHLWSQPQSLSWH